jgi:hypothetical protein
MFVCFCSNFDDYVIHVLDHDVYKRRKETDEKSLKNETENDTDIYLINT